MKVYLIKRLLYLVPSLFVIVLISFALLHYAPGDPIESILSGEGIYDNTPNEQGYKIREEIAHKLGLDLPLFYFSMSSLNESGEHKANWKNYIPAISFHNNNQFHRWMFGHDNSSGGILRGDFGFSWVTGQKVSSIISGKIKWSLFFTITSILLAYLISIPSGLIAAAKPGSFFDRSTSVLFTILFSLPAFWFATLLMMLFSNPDNLNILPSSGVGPTGGFPDNFTLFDKFSLTLPYLILPTICYTYGSLAFISRNVKVSVSEIMKEDYIRTARAKGLTEKKIIVKHALRNTLLPIITIFSHVFPFAIGGSVILESVFTIPGMGLAIYQSILSQDYPVIIAVFMLTGFITMTGFIITDLLYAYTDPRISFANPERS